MNIVIVKAQWNEVLTNLMVSGAKQALERAGHHTSVVEVPGSFELPLAVAKSLSKPDVAGVVAIGVIIKGATTHNDHIASACFKGLMDVQLKAMKPVGCGVLTIETLEQGFERCGGKLGNKGSEAALAVLQQLS